MMAAAAKLSRRVSTATTLPNRSRMASNTVLKPRNTKKVAGLGGLSISAQSAGLSVSALIAEITTETEIVTANCRYSAPVTPETKPTGANTATSTSVVAITGPVISAIAFRWP